MALSTNFSHNKTSEVPFRIVEIMAIKIEMLRCFLSMVELGNLADAADRLGLTPSAA